MNLVEEGQGRPIIGVQMPQDFYWILAQPTPLAGMRYPAASFPWSNLHPDLHRFASRYRALHRVRQSPVRARVASWWTSFPTSHVRNPKVEAESVRREKRLGYPVTPARRRMLVQRGCSGPDYLSGSPLRRSANSSRPSQAVVTITDR